MTLRSTKQFLKKIAAGAALLVVFFSPLSALAQNQPTVIIAASNITPNSARLTGHVTNPDNNMITISWGKQGQAISGTCPAPGIGLTGTDNSFVYDISNLEAATTYYVAISDAVAHTTISTSPSSFTFTTAPASVNVGENQTAGGVGVFFQQATKTDTTIAIKYMIITGGQELGFKVRYDNEFDYTTTVHNLRYTSDEFFRGSSTSNSPEYRTVTLTGLTPQTGYHLEVINSDTREVMQGTEDTYLETTAAGSTPITVNQGIATPSCADGKDNDSDGKIDYPNDPDCANAGSNAEGTCPDGQYCLLAPLPNIDSSVDFKGTSIGKYLNGIFKFMIGLSGVLAVVMLVLGGIQYMSTDAISGKEAGKERMTSSILGLLLALGAFVILNTISPTLTNLGLTIDKQEISIIGDSEAPVGDIGTFTGGSINCPGSGGVGALANVASGFLGKVTYSFGGKGAAGPENTVYLDCSGFVNRALQCSGLPFTNSGTSGIFANAEAVTSMTKTSVNNAPLQVGDLLGWTMNAQGPGHVVMYIGNGQIIDSHGPANKVGKAVSITSADYYQNRIRFIKRITP